MEKEIFIQYGALGILAVISYLLVHATIRANTKVFDQMVRSQQESMRLMAESQNTMLKLFSTSLEALVEEQRQICSTLDSVGRFLHIHDRTAKEMNETLRIAIELNSKANSIEMQR